MNMQVAGLHHSILEDKDGIVQLKGAPHKILKCNRKLVPLCIDSSDPKEIANPNSILTHRFSVCLHISLSHLKFDPKNKRFFMEAKHTLGTPECELNSITELYTNDLLKFRVINDIYKQEGNYKTHF